jgi:hypothetical protein
MAASIRERISEWLRTEAAKISGVTALRPKRVFWTEELTKDLTAVIRQRSCLIDDADKTDLIFEQEYKITIAVIDRDTAAASLDTRINLVMAAIVKALAADPSCGGLADSNGMTLKEIVSLQEDSNEPLAPGVTGESLLLQVKFSTLKTDLSAAGGV